MRVSGSHQRIGAGVLCWMLGVFAPLVWSESGFEHDHVEAIVGAHVHGEASMQVNLQENMLGIRLVIPAMDLLGYERAPLTVAEQTQFKTTLDFLTQPDNWIELGAEASCELQSYELTHPYEIDEHHGNADHSHKTKSAHVDFMIDANWRCAMPSQLASLTLSLFGQFPRVKQVRADWISNNTAGIAQLTAAEPLLFLSKPR